MAVPQDEGSIAALRRQLSELKEKLTTDYESYVSQLSELEDLVETFESHKNEENEIVEEEKESEEGAQNEPGFQYDPEEIEENIIEEHESDSGSSVMEDSQVLEQIDNKIEEETNKAKELEVEEIEKSRNVEEMINEHKVEEEMLSKKQREKAAAEEYEKELGFM